MTSLMRYKNSSMQKSSSGVKGNKRQLNIPRSSPRALQSISTQSPQRSMMVIPAGTPLMLPHSSPSTVNPIIVPNLPLDIAVKEYGSWRQSRVDSETLKDDIKKARDVVLANSLYLKQIHEDQDPGFFH
jgi:hypothetical protein